MSHARNIETHLRQKHSLPDNFRFFRWMCLPLDGPTIYYEVEGGIVNSTYRSGKRKGRPNYSKATDRRVFRMTVEEYDRLFPEHSKQSIRDMYYALHCCCPLCGSNSIEQTCEGSAFNDIATAMDSNRAVCVCGWRGIVHNLVPPTTPT